MMILQHQRSLWASLLFIFLTASGLLGPMASYGQGSACDESLNTEPVAQQPVITDSQRLLNYFGYLIGQRFITLPALEVIAKEIQTKGKITTNPIQHEIVEGKLEFKKSAHRTHYENLEYYFAHGKLNYGEILEWVDVVIAELKEIMAQRQGVERQTEIAQIRPRFHRVSDGSLAYDFEALSTPVTQLMWFEEMRENPSHFKDGPNSITLKFNRKETQLQPYNPVENITWYSAAIFANRLSRKNGLKEVYDFSRVKFKKGTSAKDGTLDIESGKVKINGPNLYETEGYRLPTVAEQMLMIAYAEDAAEGLPQEYLIDCAWFNKNSNNQTHSVGEKREIMIGNGDFYDVQGNVSEWGHSKDLDGSVCIDPSRSVCGGSYCDKPADLSSRRHTERDANTRSPTVGLRLVKTVR